MERRRDNDYSTAAGMLLRVGRKAVLGGFRKNRFFPLGGNESSGSGAMVMQTATSQNYDRGPNLLHGKIFPIAKVISLFGAV